MKQTSTKKGDEHGIYKYLKNISEVNSDDLNEYLGPVLAIETSKHNQSTQKPT